MLTLAVQHGYIPDTTERLTIKEFARKYNLAKEVVSDWIIQGIIPADATMFLKELDNLVVVKDQVYK